MIVLILILMLIMIMITITILVRRQASMPHALPRQLRRGVRERREPQIGRAQTVVLL